MKNYNPILEIVKNCGAFIAKTQYDYIEQRAKHTNKREKMPFDQKKICGSCGELNHLTASICKHCSFSLTGCELTQNVDYIKVVSRLDRKKKELKRNISILAMILVMGVIFIATFIKARRMDMDFGETIWMILAPILIGSLSILNIRKPELLFYLKHGLYVDNAEPSEFYLMTAKIGGYIGCAVAIIVSMMMLFTM